MQEVPNEEEKEPLEPNQGPATNNMQAALASIIKQEKEDEN